MRSILIITLLVFLILSMIALFSVKLEAQYFNLSPWYGFGFPSPFQYLYPWSSTPVLINPLYSGRFYRTPFSPIPLSAPVLMEPGLRIANAPLTLSLPTVTVSSPPLTAILNVIDTSLLAGNISFLTSNYPLIYDLLITTYNLPI